MSARQRKRNQRASMRMGILDLFVVIIGICLAVLAVLALSTSMASLRLSERQVQGMQQIYDVDTAGQRFAADLDGKVQEVILSGIDAGDMLTAINRELADVVDDVASASEEILVEADVRLPDQMASSFDDQYSSVDLTRYVGGVRALFTSDDGYLLTCLFGIDDKGAVDALTWKSTRVWDESAQNEQLWQG